jgi:hypothetical protein
VPCRSINDETFFSYTRLSSSFVICNVCCSSPNSCNWCIYIFEVTVSILKTRLSIYKTTPNASFRTQFIRFAVLPKIKRIDKTHVYRLKRRKKEKRKEMNFYWLSGVHVRHLTFKRNSIINWTQIKKYLTDRK